MVSWYSDTTPFWDIPPGEVASMLSSFLPIVCTLVPFFSQALEPYSVAPTAGSAALVVQLGSKDFREREFASRALDALGSSALRELRKAVKDKDPEIRRRAENLVEAIERREETARLLAPRLVRINVVDAPLATVVNDFAKTTGFSISIDESARDELRERRITLDTGETTFWKALDALCRAAGLADSTLPVHSARTVARDNSRRMQIVVEQRQAMYMGTQHSQHPHYYLRPAPKDHFFEVKRTPASFAGALRCRIGGLPGAQIRVGADEILLPIEVSGQPDVIWEQLLDFRVEQAVNDHGQQLEQPLPMADSRATQVNRVVMGLGNGMVLNSAGGLDLIAEQGGMLRLKFGEKRPRKIAKLSGTIVGQMRTPVQALLAIDDIRKQAGKTFRTSYGECLDVVAVSERPDGSVKLEIRLREPPTMLVMPGNGRIAARGNLILGGQPAFFNRLGVRTDAVLQADLRLKDQKGNALAIGPNVQYGLNLTGNMLATNVTMTIKPSKDAGTVHTLEWFGQHSTIVDVPFQFADVELP
jgi:hypothetical protein